MPSQQYHLMTLKLRLWPHRMPPNLLQPASPAYSLVTCMYKLSCTVSNEWLRQYTSTVYTQLHGIDHTTEWEHWDCVHIKFDCIFRNWSLVTYCQSIMNNENFCYYRMWQIFCAIFTIFHSIINFFPTNYLKQLYNLWPYQVTILAYKHTTTIAFQQITNFQYNFKRFPTQKFCHIR